MKKFGYIYKVTNKINKRVYIGQTVRYVSTRWYEHKKYAKNIKNNTPLARAMRKHGIENFYITIVCWCDSLKELNHREPYHIKVFQSLAPNGYNLCGGGLGGSKSDTTKEKMRLANLGKTIPEYVRKKISNSQKRSKSHWWGRKHTEKTKEKMRLANLGKELSEESKKKISSANKGRKRSEDVKLKMSISRKGKKPSLGMKHTEESKAKISEKSKLQKHPIKCLENNKVYINAARAAEDLGIKRQSIRDFFYGKTKTAKGYTFIKI